MADSSKVEKIWLDLENAYQTMGKNNSRLEFAKRLVNYSAGTAGKRGLLSIVNASGSENSELIAKRIEKVCENIPSFEQRRYEPSNMKEFYVNSFCLNDVSIEGCTSLLSVEGMFKTGSLVPIEYYDNGISKMTFCEDYDFVCNNEQQVVMLFGQLRELKNTQMYALASFIKNGMIKTPLVIAHKDILPRVEKLVGDNKVKLLGSSEYVDSQMYKVRDKYSDVYFIVWGENAK